MRKAISAILLVLLISTGTAAHISEPIRPIPQDLFKSLPTSPIILEPDTRPDPTKPIISVPKVEPIIVATETAKTSTSGFKYDPEVSWYGPNFYGKRTACGHAYTKTILGVAHRSLPCGTLVTFMWKGRIRTVPVIDRGPYVDGRQWDLSGGLYVKFNETFPQGFQRIKNLYILGNSSWIKCRLN
jgi:rare lipoprotein A (peptidoglycan hydrolase)